jgi:hypothetical protein
MTALDERTTMSDRLEFFDFCYIHTIYDEDDYTATTATDGRTDCARDTIYAYELKVVVMPVIYVAFRLCDYNLYVCPALRNETCF